jgi:hypothetical protein
MLLLLLNSKDLEPLERLFQEPETKASQKFVLYKRNMPGEINLGGLDLI